MGIREEITGAVERFEAAEREIAAAHEGAPAHELLSQARAELERAAHPAYQRQAAPIYGRIEGLLEQALAEFDAAVALEADARLYGLRGDARLNARHLLVQALMALDPRPLAREAGTTEDYLARRRRARVVMG